MLPLLILNGLPQQNISNQLNKDVNASSTNLHDGGIYYLYLILIENSKPQNTPNFTAVLSIEVVKRIFSRYILDV